jgi:hypothetical protein
MRVVLKQECYYNSSTVPLLLLFIVNLDVMSEYWGTVV